MEIRDPVHGAIHILKEEIPIIRHPFFQRLRNIKQLGPAEYVFPGATHTRYLHSLGVMWVGQRVVDQLFTNAPKGADLNRLKETFKLACLLHDIGHAPLSHACEVAMPKLGQLNMPKEFLHQKELSGDRQATHEDYTIKAIVDSTFSESFTRCENEWGLDKKRVADLIRGQTSHPEYFTIEGINYFPLLSQLVSSELDCDRMDYLLRDSYFCGVSYGRYDMDWLIDNMEICVENNQAVLGLSERAVVTFDDFLLGRYHMFVMVYFHYRAVCLEQILAKYLLSAPDEYRIPPDIEDYIEHDDHFLMKALRKSKNKYAQSLVKNQIPQKLYESFNDQQLKTLEEIQSFLQDQGVDYIRCSSTGRLSKYYDGPQAAQNFDIKVVRKLFSLDGKENMRQSASLSNATDLFQKFSKSHAVNRLHCDWDNLKAEQQMIISRLIKSDLSH